MRTVTILSFSLLLVSPGWVVAQATNPTANTPEVFHATAVAKNASGAVSGTVEVRVQRYTPDFDRKTVEDALRFGGYPKFLGALRNAPEVGQVILGGGQPYAIRYARETVDRGVRTIVVVTDKPVVFVGAGRSDAKPRTGYEVGVLRLQLDAKGSASGTMAGAARVRPDGSGGVLLDDYADAPIELTNVTRKPS